MWWKSLFPVLLCATLGASLAAADDTSSAVRQLRDGQAPGKATIADFAWLEGDWVAVGSGGMTLKSYSAPAHGQMMGMFRLTTEGGIRFYEFVVLSEGDGTVTYQLKHFRADLTGWEEKDEHVAFPLVELTPEAAYFAGMTIERTGPNSFTSHVSVRTSDGETRVVSTRYRRK
jgi:hypothetical protein